MSLDRGPVEIAADCMVIGYDLGDSSRRAVSWAAQSLTSDGTLVIVHACRPLHTPPSPFMSSVELSRLRHAVLNELMMDGEGSMLDSVNLVTEVSDQDPATTLLDAAKRHRANAIVVGSEQHSKLGRALGTVTSELQRTSPVPVIVVPPKLAVERPPESDQ